jgi:hypothetical protein
MESVWTVKQGANLKNLSSSKKKEIEEVTKYTTKIVMSKPEQRKKEKSDDRCDFSL